MQKYNNTMEIWRDIKGFEGLYQVSNLGRVKSLSNNKSRKEKIRSFKTDADGYLRVDLWKNGLSITKQVQSLVAEAFIPNPENKPEVHHIDGDTQNNQVSNLMWVTREEHRAIDRAKKVLCVETGKVYESIIEAARHIGACPSSITLACSGKQKTAKGYHWQYYTKSN